MGDEAILTAAAGAFVQEMRFEIIANNLANVDTIGFKADRAVFQSVMASVENPEEQSGLEPIETTVNLNEISTDSSTCLVEFKGTEVDFTPGNIKQTGNTFDFALEGEGFFCVLSPQGTEQYTRKGNFKLSEDGKLITQEGLTVLGQNGKEIAVSGQDMVVDENGNILVDGTTIDKLKIVNFPKPYPLVKAGDASVFSSDSAFTGQDAENVVVKQGFIEESNVDPIRSMTEMIEVHRAYESYQKVLKSMDDILSKTVTEIGRIS